MYDHNVFAVLTAIDESNRASSAFNLPENATWFCGATGGVAARPTIDSRESTPAEGLGIDQDTGAANRLVLTFDKLLQTNLLGGVQFGTDPDVCHVVLGHRGTPAISRRHFNITVDGQFRIWLRDSSQFGTAVGYNRQCKGEVRRFQTWILSYEPGTASVFQPITIHTGRLVVRIEFPSHGNTDPRYIDNLQYFFDECNQSVLTAAGLNLATGPTTAAPSQSQTPGEERQIYFIGKSVGRGAFGEVYKAFRVCDGMLCAAKTFRLSGSKRKRDETKSHTLDQMRKEFSIMKDHSHPNIARVYEFREIPRPVLFMDYYPLGNIEDIGKLSDEKSVTAMGQLLDGLGHLHRNKVAHRDLKPGNVLVTWTPVLKFVITDFGLAKIATESTLLTSFCGTRKYMAPEIFPNVCDRYSLVVDIWSLGVMIFEMMYGIPVPPKHPPVTRSSQIVDKKKWGHWIDMWSQSLLKKLGDQEDNLVVDILNLMLKYDPKDRWGADACLNQGIQNKLFRRLAIGNVDLVFCVDYKEETQHPAIQPRSPMEAASSSSEQHLRQIPSSPASSSQGDRSTERQAGRNVTLQGRL